MDFIENVMFKPDTPANVRKKIREYVKKNPDASEADVLEEFGPSLRRAIKFEKKQKDKEATERSDRMLIQKANNAKAQMMKGGMANGKEHMYSAGGAVTDKLPNKGLRKLASTTKGRKAVRNMGFDV